MESLVNLDLPSPKQGRDYLKDTILIDFDGVLRHWSGTEVNDAEHKLGLDSGTLFSWAFSPQMLTPAITGSISHEAWMQRVKVKLTYQYSDEIASQLIAAWQSASWKIDHDLLQNIQQRSPAFKLVLVTNATSRLNSDLKEANLDSTFDVIVNSSQINVTKPKQLFFETALSIAGSQASDAIFIDDSLDNVNAARAMGIESIHHRITAETLEFIFAAIEDRYYQEPI